MAGGKFCEQVAQSGRAATAYCYLIAGGIRKGDIADCPSMLSGV